MKLFTYKVLYVDGKKYYNLPFMRLKFTVSWWNLIKVILTPFNIFHSSLTSTLYQYKVVLVVTKGIAMGTSIISLYF